MNWRPRIDAVQKCFNFWRHRSLSYGGRVLVSNALTLSCIWYAASLFSTPSWVWRELNTALLNFFWEGKKDLVAFDAVIHHREDGGFQLVSFPSLAKYIPSLHSGSSVCVSPCFFVDLLVLQPFWRRSRVCFSHPYPCLPGFCRLSMLPCSILRTS